MGDLRVSTDGEKGRPAQWIFHPRKKGKKDGEKSETLTRGMGGTLRKENSTRSKKGRASPRSSGAEKAKNPGEGKEGKAITTSQGFLLGE